MAHPIHRPTVHVIEGVTRLMDELLRYHIDNDEYAAKLREFDVDSILEEHKEEFKTNPSLVPYLDALMLISSLQHELEFQVAEYGANVALEDMKVLKELMERFPG
jgi:hypothetical protein